MLQYLYKYLVLNKHVSIPGIGNFNIIDVPAVYVANEQTITPPGKKLDFHHNTAISDKSFYRFISHELAISEVDAVRKFQDYSYSLRQEIQANEFVHLAGMGRLKKDPIHEMIFEPELSISGYFAPVSLQPSIIQEPNLDFEPPADLEQPVIQEPEVQDRWWIWALVLALAAISAMAYYYMQEF